MAEHIDTFKGWAESIRGDVGLSKDFSPEFLERSTKAAQAAFPELAK